jgi:TetR/AcrR family transcriptional regulator
MSDTEEKLSRRDQILQALARMLEVNPGGRITTSNLAKEVGVSEAALYRHFPSKAKMFEGLIEFIELTLFSRINTIVKEEPAALEQCEKIIGLLLTFTEKNPGITRLLTGDALAGETDRLRIRIAQLFNRLETQLKQILREAELREGVRTKLSPSQTANLLIVFADGKISQFVRSEFNKPPTEAWQEQWLVLTSDLFNPA